MKVYIAGKITGFPGYRQQFMAAEARLAGFGHSVMNPAWLYAYPAFSYKDYIAIAQAMLERCDGILLLSNWEQSPGAKREKALAEKRGMRVFDGKTGEAGCWQELACAAMEEGLGGHEADFAAVWEVAAKGVKK